MAFLGRGRGDLLFFSLFSLFVAGNFISPLSRGEGSTSLQLRVVQPNTGNLIKMASEQGDEAAWRAVVESYYQMSVEPSEHPLDLIIWPETAIADVLNSKTYSIG